MTAPEVDAGLAALRAHCRVLRMPTVARECEGLARQALDEGWSPLAYLRTLLDAEVATRADHAVARRQRGARFPALKTLTQFDWTRPHGLDRAHVEDLARAARGSAPSGARSTAIRSTSLPGLQTPTELHPEIEKFRLSAG